MKKKKALLPFLLLLIIMFLIPPHTVNAAAKINHQTYYLQKGKAVTLKVSGKRNVKWSSSKKSVATVSASGKVTAKGFGSATITGKVGSKKFKCKIYVERTIARLSLKSDVGLQWVALTVRNACSKNITVPKSMVVESDFSKTTFTNKATTTIKPGQYKTIKFYTTKKKDSVEEDESDPYDDYDDDWDWDTDVYDYWINLKSAGKTYKFWMCYQDYTGEYGYRENYILYVNKKRISPKINNPDISYAEFQKIKVGMTYKQVVQIIGGDGELTSSGGSGNYRYETYQWDGEYGEYTWAIINFVNGKVQSKSQYGL